MKTYITRMLKNNTTNEQVWTYIVEISLKISFRILYLITRKITHKILPSLSTLDGITFISKSKDKNNILLIKNLKQLITLILITLSSTF